MNKLKWLAVSAAALAAMGAALAQTNNTMPMQHGTMPMQHGTMQMAHPQPQGDTGPSSQAFQGVNAKMHEAMAITFTGNADVDFVRGMIPHHQGAIDMAKIELAFGKDPEIRKLAEGIIKAQEDEITLMNAWLKQHGQ